VGHSELVERLLEIVEKGLPFCCRDQSRRRRQRARQESSVPGLILARWCCGRDAGAQGDVNMENAGTYHERTEECRRRAAEAKWPPDKLNWAELARAWFKLARRSGSQCVPAIGRRGTNRKRPQTRLSVLGLPWASQAPFWFLTFVSVPASLGRRPPGRNNHDGPTAERPR
jgi:hypothetical protein